jgi:hypothetical protein
VKRNFLTEWSLIRCQSVECPHMMERFLETNINEETVGNVN